MVSTCWEEQNQSGNKTIILTFLCAVHTQLGVHMCFTLTIQQYPTIKSAKLAHYHCTYTHKPCKYVKKNWALGRNILYHQTQSNACFVTKSFCKTPWKSMHKSYSILKSLDVHTTEMISCLMQTMSLNLFSFFYADSTQYRSLSVMRNPTSKYCIHVQIQEDVPHLLINLGALKFLLHQKMSVLFMSIFFIVLIQKNKCRMHSANHTNRKIFLQKYKDMGFFIDRYAYICIWIHMCLGCHWSSLSRDLTKFSYGTTLLLF